jgi:hypothetical protein
MFPASLKFPKYKESWILSLVDKTISTKELLQYKFSYTKVTNKVTNRLNLVGLCAFYILTMGRK